ncbi:hypothetical protein OPKNFCMD_5858 [Methylobacterium crusticola]|uniref:Kazal-like domain-containing protein n=1 Tax=Methylobacterium crusticola TaxID=1697972 RepID=A0ABQ4R6P0_9HYPH|nr:hypothetical protein [Methylobacterium crusticola]GJD53087.1 hypothetical protein OPKNFCMD_5858 [Methylobacterium crusticola]
MRIAIIAASGVLSMFLASATSYAQSAEIPAASNIVSCRPFNNTGEATRISSLNDVCPQHAFFREDCQRDVMTNGADPKLYSAHCLNVEEFRNFSFK